MIFISGIGPGEAGASGFYSYIEKISIDRNVPSIYPYKHKSFRRLFYRNKIEAIYYLLKINFHQLIFIYKVLSLKSQKIILAHPQGIGLILTMFLILRHNKINYYVLDNSFFCIQSYNFHPKEGECLRCLALKKYPFRDCKSFPGIRPKFLHLFFIRFLMRNQKKIKFFFQNDKNLDLFKMHMKYIKVKYEKVGLLTTDIKSSFNDLGNIKKISKVKIKKKFSLNFPNKKIIVFHGNNNDAKGTKVAYKIAELLPNYNFIFPFPKPRINLTNNCFFVPCSWDTGLKEIITYADCVICTSVWSAPIEAALIKSIIYNGLVITAENVYSFSSEIPSDLKLLFKNESSVKYIRKVLKDKVKVTKIRKNLQLWIKDYFKKNSLENIFIFN